LLKIILPSALPAILTGLRLGLIYAWLGTVGAEYLFTTTAGIGSMMIDARDLFRMDLVILGMIVIGGVGFAINVLLNRIGNLPLWRGTEEII
jgi:sulfonate transport system permease protein